MNLRKPWSRTADRDALRAARFSRSEMTLFDQAGSKTSSQMTVEEYRVVIRFYEALVALDQNAHGFVPIHLAGLRRRLNHLEQTGRSEAFACYANPDKCCCA